MTKFAIKCGDIEIDYDGPEEFLKDELPGLIKAVAALRSSTTAKPTSGNPVPPAPPVLTDGAMSVSTIAQKLAVANGPDLIVAAALSLAGAGNGGFTKRQLRERIREATTFFRSTYSNNFDNYVKVLVKKGRLNHSGGENYALPAAERAALESRLTSAGA